MTKSTYDNHHETQGISITIRSHKGTKIQILMERNISGYTLVTSVPTATRVGSTVSWTINIDAGSTATIYYEWEHYW